MKFVFPDAVQLKAGLRALKTLALVDGALDPAEAQVLTSAQQALGSSTPVAALQSITPRELAEQIGDPAVAFQLLGGMVVMAVADGEVQPSEAELLGLYAEALGVQTSAVANLERIAEGHYRRARLDILRRQWAIKKLRDLAEEDGAKVYLKAALGLLRLREDAALTQRYVSLGEMPEGSLGKAYFDYMVSRDFLFPGERGAPPEAMIFHDMTHILSGYGTTAENEILTATFSAGYSTYEVHNWLVFVLSQFQLGLQTAPNVPPARLQLNPTRLIAAYRRGCEVAFDLNAGWDPWEVMAEPVAVLRKRYNILPEERFLPAA